MRCRTSSLALRLADGPAACVDGAIAFDVVAFAFAAFAYGLVGTVFAAVRGIGSVGGPLGAVTAKDSERVGGVGRGDG